MKANGENLNLRQSDKLCWCVSSGLFSSEGERQTGRAEVEEESHDDERGMTKGKREEKERVETRRETGVGGQI